MFQRMLQHPDNTVPLSTVKSSTSVHAFRVSGRASSAEDVTLRALYFESNLVIVSSHTNSRLIPSKLLLYDS